MAPAARCTPALGVLLFCLGAGGAHALTLAEGLAVVSTSGRAGEIAEAAAEVARTAPAIARAARLPSVDAFARETVLAYAPASDVGLGRPIPLADRESFSYGLRVRQLLWDFGRTDAAVRAADLDAEAAGIDAELAGNREALAFIIAYLRLLRAERLLAVAAEETTRFAAHRDDARALVEEGAATENDLLLAEVRLADAEQRRLQAENARALAAAAVNSLLRRPLGAEVEAEELPPRAGSGEAVALEEALAEAAGRAELRRARAGIAAAEAGREAARTGYFPQLYLGGGYEFTRNPYQVHEGNWSLLAGLDVNLFAGGATRERVARQERQVRLLESTLGQLRDAVALEVRAAALDRENGRARAAAAGAAVDQARENLRLQKLRYAEGVGTATEVLDAVSLASTAEQNRLNARYDVIEAEARLDFAAGRDLAARWGGGATAPRGDEEP